MDRRKFHPFGGEIGLKAGGCIASRDGLIYGYAASPGRTEADPPQNHRAAKKYRAISTSLAVNSRRRT
jgi:hypothetical protein